MDSKILQRKTDHGNAFECYNWHINTLVLKYIGEKRSWFKITILITFAILCIWLSIEELLSQNKWGQTGCIAKDILFLQSEPKVFAQIYPSDWGSFVSKLSQRFLAPTRLDFHRGMTNRDKDWTVEHITLFSVKE